MNEPAIQLSENDLDPSTDATLISLCPNQKPRCQAITRSGVQCTKQVSGKHPSRCRLHNPANKEKLIAGARHARKMQTTNGKAVKSLDSVQDFYPGKFETPDDILDVLHRMVKATLTGELDPKLATSATYELNAAFRGLELNKPKMNENKLRLKLKTVNLDGSSNEMEIEGPADAVNEVATKDEKETEGNQTAI